MDNFRKLFEADQKKFTNGIKAISKKCKKGVVSLSDEEGILKGFSKDPKEFKSEVATIKKTFDNEFGEYFRNLKAFKSHMEDEFEEMLSYGGEW